MRLLIGEARVEVEKNIYNSEYRGTDRIYIVYPDGSILDFFINLNYNYTDNQKYVLMGKYEFMSNDIKNIGKIMEESDARIIREAMVELYL